MDCFETIVCSNESNDRTKVLIGKQAFWVSGSFAESKAGFKADSKAGHLGDPEGLEGLFVSVALS